MKGSSPHTAPVCASVSPDPASPEAPPIEAHARSQAPTPASFAARSARFERITEEGRRFRRSAENDLAAGAEERHVMHVPLTLAMPASPRQALVVDAAGVGELLAVSERLVRKLDATGHLPVSIRFGTRAVWAVAELTAWVAAGAPRRDEWIRAKRQQVGGAR